MTDEEYKLKTEQMRKLIDEVHEEKSLRYSVELYKEILDNLKNNGWSINTILFHDKSNYMVNDRYVINYHNLFDGCKKQEGLYKDAAEDLKKFVIEFLEIYIKKLEE